MAISFFRVLFHALDGSGKPLQAFGTHIENVAAAASDSATLVAVLASNGVSVPAGTTIVIDSVSSPGASTYLT